MEIFKQTTGYKLYVSTIHVYALTVTVLSNSVSMVLPSNYQSS